MTTILSLASLIDCVCERLATVGQGPTCHCSLYPGEVVSWEYCGECSDGVCGMGYVRPAGVFPYNQFPLPTVDIGCVSPLAIAVEVGVLRCMPTMTETGELPNEEALTVATEGQIADMWALYQAIKCCDIRDVAVDQWVPLGPQGGCVGGAFTIFADVTDAGF